MTSIQKLEMCQAIMALAIRINEQEDVSVWCNFSGHVNRFEVLITPSWVKGIDYIDGWSIGDKYAYLDDENALEKLEMIKGELIKFLER